MWTQRPPPDQLRMAPHWFVSIRSFWTWNKIDVIWTSTGIACFATTKPLVGGLYICVCVPWMQEIDNLEGAAERKRLDWVRQRSTHGGLPACNTRLLLVRSAILWPQHQRIRFLGGKQIFMVYPATMPANYYCPYTRQYHHVYIVSDLVIGFILLYFWKVGQVKWI